MGIFTPKGPFPFYIADLERDTLGWPKAMLWHYVKLLCHLWSQGAFMPDDDVTIRNAAGIPNNRHWKGRVQLIRSKLVPVGDRINAGEDEAEDTRIFLKSYLSHTLGNRKYGGEITKGRVLTQKRVLRDVAKAYSLSQKRSSSGRRGGRPRQSNSLDEKKQLKSTPTPTLYTPPPNRGV